MEKNRRSFLKLVALGGVSLAGAGIMKGFSADEDKINTPNILSMKNPDYNKEDFSIIGPYGPWASSINENKLPAYSFRRKEWSDIETWRNSAKGRLAERLAIPDLGGMPNVKVNAKYVYDGLHIEELSWQLPYGRPTEAILLKPENAKQPLPGILAFHDHAANKYFGKRKITQTADSRHPLMEEHHIRYYDNLAWANEVAKRGYVVLVPDAFPFASRRVMLQDVPEHMRQGLDDQNSEDPDNIEAYNQWAAQHESVMAKSLFSAGTTWPGVFFAEDKKALDILCARDDVNENYVGCGGLSGGGMRTAFMGGLDARIKCAVCVGFMTTWKDLVLHKSFTHTWMAFAPLVPNELDFPEILGLRTPLPTLVLNTNEDDLYTLAYMKEADEILKEVYKKANAVGNYKGSFHPGEHKFDKPMQSEAFDWFDQWLKD